MRQQHRIRIQYNQVIQHDTAHYHTVYSELPVAIQAQAWRDQLDC